MKGVYDKFGEKQAPGLAAARYFHSLVGMNIHPHRNVLTCSGKWACALWFTIHVLQVGIKIIVPGMDLAKAHYAGGALCMMSCALTREIP